MLTPESQFIEAACVPIAGNHRSTRLSSAEGALASHPKVIREDFSCACAYGNSEALGSLLAGDASLARRKIGPRHWEPMLYVCFSVFASPKSARAAQVVRSARLLLETGAEPNPSFLADSRDPKTVEPAIYGAAGVWNNAGLTRLLLEAGADPNDPETPYHAPEHADGAALKLIWPQLRAGGRATAVLRLLDHHNLEVLRWALEHGADASQGGTWEDQPLHHSIRRLNGLPFQELLLKHGADVKGQTRKGMTVYQIAARHGRKDVIERIKSRGADDDLSEVDRFIFAMASGDGPAARAALAANPRLVAELKREDRLAVNSAAGQGQVEAVRLMLDLGLPIAEPGINGHTPLHYAASHGHLEAVALLLDRGAPVAARQMQGLTPLDLTLDFVRNGWVNKPETPEIIRRLVKAGSPPGNYSDLPPGLKPD